MLRVSDLQAGYGTSQILFDINMTLAKGQIVSLLGRNGMGKSTTIKSIMGLIDIINGQILFNNSSLVKQPSFRISRLGIAYVPENRRIFANLSARENLLATARDTKNPGKWTLEKVLALFPQLKPCLSQMGGTLSGGEQQMLAIARALLLNPKLLILDEATEGLAPLIRQQIWDALFALKVSGLSILIVDKHIAKLKTLADFHYIIENGSIVWQGNSAALGAAGQETDRYIGIQ